LEPQLSLIKSLPNEKLSSTTFKRKNGSFSLRELAIALFILVIIVSWIAKQFSNMTYLSSCFTRSCLVGAGCFGYSIEKKTNP
jgi:hypothetical protein